MLKIELGEKQSDKFGPSFQYEIPFLITTPNLLIRPLVSQDKGVLLEALRDSLKMLHMWLPWSSQTPNANDFVSLGEKFYKESTNEEVIHYAVYANDKFMGMCSLSHYSIEFSSVRLGFWCRSSPGDENYFLEAINGVLRYTFENMGIVNVYIPCMVGNFASEYFAKELNFKLASIEIINGSQIKIFRTDASNALPNLEIHWVKNDQAVKR
jgi:RimJ/RimL family protein N-acetyltransferase